MSEEHQHMKVAVRVPFLAGDSVFGGGAFPLVGTNSATANLYLNRETLSFPPPADWSSATAYSVGTRVRDSFSVYEARTANTNRPPATSPNDWIFVSGRSERAAFDSIVNTAVGRNSSTPTFWTARYPAHRVDTVAFFGCRAQEVRVRVIDPDTSTVIYDRTKSMIDTGHVADLWGFFFAPLAWKEETLFENVPGHPGMNIEVSIARGPGDSGSNPAYVGEIFLGQSRTIGTTLMGAKVYIEDFSRKERDTFGNFTIVQRAYSDNADFPVLVRTNQVESVRSFLASLRATPAVYHVGEQGEAKGLLAYGLFKDFEVNIVSGEVSSLTLSIEGLT